MVSQARLLFILYGPLLPDGESAKEKDLVYFFPFNVRCEFTRLTYTLMIVVDHLFIQRLIYPTV